MIQSGYSLTQFMRSYKHVPCRVRKLHTPADVFELHSVRDTMLSYGIGSDTVNFTAVETDNEIITFVPESRIKCPEA